MSLFVAWIPDETEAASLLSLRDDIAAGLRSSAGFRWRPRETLHMTLRFLGHVVDETAPALQQALADIAAGSDRIALRFDRAEVWTSAKALVARPQDSDALRSLLERIDAAATTAGYAAHAGRQTPHVTLAYADDARIASATTPIEPALDVTFGHVSIVETVPSGYAVRHWWPLQKRAPMFPDDPP